MTWHTVNTTFSKLKRTWTGGLRLSKLAAYLGLCTVVSANSLMLTSPVWAAATTTPPVKVMPLGDSITDGYSTPGGYRIGLWDRIVNQDQLGMDFVGSLQNGPATLPDQDHEGHIGYRIDQIRSNVDAWLSAAQPQVVMLLIGTNDILQGYNLSTAPARLSDLVNEICVDRPGANVVVSNIPTSLDNDGSVQSYNAAIPGVVSAAKAKGCNASFVDMYSVLTLSDLADGTHPTPAGYDKMAQVWHDAIKPMLAGTTATPPTGLTLAAQVDEKTLTGTNKFAYTGTWVDCGGCNAGAYQGSFKYSYTTGNSAVFSFTGTEAKLYGFKEPNGGIASISVDGGTPVDTDYYAATQALSNTYTTPLLTQGAHTMTITVSGRKNAASGSPTINIDEADVYTGGTATPPDTTAPTVTLTAPTTGASYTIGSTVPLAATASDDVGVSKVEFYVDGTLQTTDTAAPYTASLNTTGMTAGSHSITAKAYDAAGNSTTSTAASITLAADTTSPVVSVTSPTGGSSAAIGSSLSLAATASDNIAVSKVEFYVDSVLKSTVTASPYTASVSTTGMSAGSHSITAKAYDAAGNVTTSAAVSITLTAATNPLTLSAKVDDKTTTGTNKFAYSGTWVDCGGCKPASYQNSFKYAYTTGAKATFTFTGTEAKLYNIKEPNGGIASVSIDGGTAVDVDDYATTASVANVYTTPLLAQGTHTLTITVSGRKNAASGSPTISIDEADVYTGGN